MAEKAGAEAGGDDGSSQVDPDILDCGAPCESSADCCSDNLFCCPNKKLCMYKETGSTVGMQCGRCNPITEDCDQCLEDLGWEGWTCDMVKLYE